MQSLIGLFNHYNYVITIFLMMAGLYIVVARGNMVKKLVGLSIFQTSVYLLYIGPQRSSAAQRRSSIRHSRPIQSAPHVLDPHRHRLVGNAGARLGAGRAHQRGLRHH
jgi:multisubunit Na+/H+ antiporter MnhC subunit